MNTLEVGKKLVSYCKEGKNLEAIESLYSPDIVSVEAASGPGMPAEMKGISAIKEKNQWWFDNHTVHSGDAEGPFPQGDRFCVKFQYDATDKKTKERFKMEEVGLYTVKNDKIVKEEFFYVM
jgi:SnoaL-like domain